MGGGGYAPLSYSTIADWARLKKVDIEPHEVEALILLDAAMLSPDDTTETQEAPAAAPPARAWPTKKEPAPPIHDDA